MDACTVKFCHCFVPSVHMLVLIYCRMLGCLLDLQVFKLSALNLFKKTKLVPKYIIKIYVCAPGKHRKGQLCQCCHIFGEACFLVVESSKGVSPIGFNQPPVGIRSDQDPSERQINILLNGSKLHLAQRGLVGVLVWMFNDLLLHDGPAHTLCSCLCMLDLYGNITQFLSPTRIHM